MKPSFKTIWLLLVFTLAPMCLMSAPKIVAIDLTSENFQDRLDLTFTSTNYHRIWVEQSSCLITGQWSRGDIDLAKEYFSHGTNVFTTYWPTSNISQPRFFRICSAEDADQALSQIYGLKSVLNSYWDAYGTFPPVSTTVYEYEDASTHPGPFAGYFSDNPDADVGYRYGLVAYLWPRYRTSIVNTNNNGYIPDTEFDVITKQTWQEELNGYGLTLSTSHVARVYNAGEGVFIYSNKVENIRNPWGFSLSYQSDPPHQAYILTSSGPDGFSVTVTNSTD